MEKYFLFSQNYGKWEGKKDLEVQAAAAIAGVRPYQLNEGVAEKYEDFKDKCCKYFLVSGANSISS